jgi:hypothetical protein
MPDQVEVFNGPRVLDTRIPETLRKELIADARGYQYMPPHPRGGGAFAKASLKRADGAPPRLVRSYFFPDGTPYRLETSDRGIESTQPSRIPV